MLDESKLAQLKTILAPAIFQQLNAVLVTFDIINSLRAAHFLAQCHHESGNFRLTHENLNYSAARLREVFPKYFNFALSEQCDHKPADIANIVYSNRMGNGSSASGDGYRYRGRGYIQLTGRDNYKNLSSFIGDDVVSNPDLVESKYPMASAAYFFRSNRLWALCDAGATEQNVKNITRRVNGGTNGLARRIELFNMYYKIIAGVK